VFYVATDQSDDAVETDYSCNKKYIDKGIGPKGNKFMSTDPAYKNACKKYIIDESSLLQCKKDKGIFD
jgi:hypothetical protein